MSNRSTSYLKRLKTQKTQRSHILGWKPSIKTPSSRVQHTSRSPAPRQQFEKIHLKQKDNYLIKCVNHPLKRALFEPRQSLKQAYCQDCSIRLVKQNLRMVRISEQSLYIRTQYEAQIQRLLSYEQQIKQMLDKYFQIQKQALRIAFLSARQQTQKVINLPHFKIQKLNQQDLTKKLKQMIGTIYFKKVQFVHKNPQITKQKSNNYHQINPTKQFDIQLYQSILNKQNRNSQNISSNKLSFDLHEGKMKRMPSLVSQKSACLK